MKQILSGIGVSEGRASGTVRIIPEHSEKSKFTEGNVLVTRITNPTMTLMMNKAAAIVCDLGGMTSHPAIISREMGIPCVVATQKATAILKDGMRILVDGKTGKIYEL